MEPNHAAGMVALLRGLNEAGLSVSFTDNAFQQTKPIGNQASYNHNQRHDDQMRYGQPAMRNTGTNCTERAYYGANLRDNAAQACDGRYASVYKTTVCKMKPTSPPELFSEFPPQRRDKSPGRDNFIVGTVGGGDNRVYLPVKRSACRRGVINADRGIVLSRSHSPDAFASTLRRYTNNRPDKNCEIMEKLLNYTQGKHSVCKQSTSRQGCRQSSPARVGCDSVEERGPGQLRSDESPTRGPRKETVDKRPFMRNYEVQHMKEFRDHVSRNPYPSPTRQAWSPTGAPKNQSQHRASNAVFADIQTSNRRDTCTSSPSGLLKSSVAIPLSSGPSRIANQEGAVPSQRIHLSPQSLCRVAHACLEIVNMGRPIQCALAGAVSSVDLNQRSCLHTSRKSKSDAEFKLSEKAKLAKLLQWFDNRLPTNLETNKKEVIEKIKELTQVLGKIDDGKENIAEKEVKFSSMKEECFKNDRCSFGRNNFKICTQVYRTELCYDIFEGTEIREVLADWLESLPLIDQEIMMDPAKKEQIINFILKQLKRLALRNDYSVKHLKSVITDMLSDMPVDFHGVRDKTVYLDMFSATLLERLGNVQQKSLRKKWTSDAALPDDSSLTEAELKLFINDELHDLLYQANVKLSVDELKEVGTELNRIINDLITNSCHNVNGNTEKRIAALFRNTDKIVGQQAEYCAQILMRHLRELLHSNYQATNQTAGNHNHEPQTDTIDHLQECKDVDTSNKENVSRNYRQPNESITGTSQRYTEANLMNYIQKICHQIDEWLNSIRKHVPQAHDPNFRRLVIEDLAGDIVERLKYRELNSSIRSSDQEELEHLRYQIYKWVNKLAGENSTDTIQSAPELMKRIRNVPLPKLSRTTSTNKIADISTEFSSQPVKLSVNFSQQDIIRTGSAIKFRRLRDPEHYPLNKHRQKSKSNLSQVAPSTNKTAYNSTGFPSQPVKLTVNISQQDLIRMGSATQNRKQSDPGNYPLNEHRQKNQNQCNMAQGAEPSNNVNKPNTSQVAGPSNAVRQPYRKFVARGDSQEYDKQYNSLIGMPHEQMHEHLEKFLQEWAKRIPIDEEKSLADKMRQGLVNGVWKAIAKVNIVPGTIESSFYYQDLLDDEIEDLLSCVPSNPELNEQKHRLKLEVINKASAVHSQIKRNLAPETYKQHLEININNYIPRLKVEDPEEPNNLLEELLVMRLVEEFILFNRYKDEDLVKANVYRTRLLKRMQELVDELKRTHGQELKDINKDLYMDELMSALQQVPMPSDETLREEADAILLGLEIEQWFEDLPIAHTDDEEELMKRRRLRERLTHKIHDMENTLDLSDSSTTERAIKHEVSKFLDKMPLGRDETLNINNMVEQLTHRMKNRPRSTGFQNRRRSVGFADTLQYDDFSSNVNFHSSLTNMSAGASHHGYPQHQMSMHQQSPRQRRLSFDENATLHSIPAVQHQQMPMQIPVATRRISLPTKGTDYPMYNYSRANMSLPNRRYASQNQSLGTITQNAPTMSLWDPSGDEHYSMGLQNNSLAGAQMLPQHMASQGVLVEPAQPINDPFAMNDTEFMTLLESSGPPPDFSVMNMHHDTFVEDPMNYTRFDQARPLASSPIFAGRSGMIMQSPSKNQPHIRTMHSTNTSHGSDGSAYLSQLPENLNSRSLHSPPNISRNVLTGQQSIGSPQSMGNLSLNNLQRNAMSSPRIGMSATPVTAEHQSTPRNRSPVQRPQRNVSDMVYRSMRSETGGESGHPLYSPPGNLQMVPYPRNMYLEPSYHQAVPSFDATPSARSTPYWISTPRPGQQGSSQPWFQGRPSGQRIPGSPRGGPGGGPSGLGGPGRPRSGFDDVRFDFNGPEYCECRNLPKRYRRDACYPMAPINCDCPYFR